VGSLALTSQRCNPQGNVPCWISDWSPISNSGIPVPLFGLEFQLFSQTGLLLIPLVPSDRIPLVPSDRIPLVPSDRIPLVPSDRILVVLQYGTILLFLRPELLLLLWPEQ
jgi:hypothetical protein